MNAPLMEQYVLITGSPTTGFVLTGPFNTREEAGKYALRAYGISQASVGWWVAPLFNPKE